jgi:hypothetical protein
MFMKIVGVAGFRRQFHYLADTYRRTMAALREATPEVENQVREMAAIARELEALRREFDAGRLNPSEYQERSARLQADMARIQDVERRLSSTYHVVTTAVDPAGLQEVLSQLYASLASCVAAASSKYFKLCSIGFSIGHVISDRLAVVMQARKERLQCALKQTTTVGMRFIANTVDTASTQTTDARTAASRSAVITAAGSEATILMLQMIEDSDWITPTAHCVGNAVGWLIAYYLQSIASAISACSLGSEMVVSAFQDIVDPYLERKGMPTTRSPRYTETVALVQSGLVGFGVARIVHSRGLFASSSLGFVGNILLFPLVLTEKVVNAGFAVIGVSSSSN